MSVDLYFAAPLIINDVSANVREAIRAKVWASLESEKRADFPRMTLAFWMLG